MYITFFKKKFTRCLSFHAYQFQCRIPSRIFCIAGLFIVVGMLPERALSGGLIDEFIVPPPPPPDSSLIPPPRTNDEWVGVAAPPPPPPPPPFAERSLATPPSGDALIPGPRHNIPSLGLLGTVERQYLHCVAYSALVSKEEKAAFMLGCFTTEIIDKATPSKCIRGCRDTRTLPSLPPVPQCSRMLSSKDKAINLLRPMNLAQDDSDLDEFSFERDKVHVAKGCVAVLAHRENIDKLKKTAYEDGYQAGKLSIRSTSPSQSDDSNNKRATNLSTSCASVRQLSITSGVEMWVEVTNNCGQCANISMNWSLNGELKSFAGTWNNVPPGEANRYRVPLNQGFGAYKAVVVRVEACS